MFKFYQLIGLSLVISSGYGGIEGLRPKIVYTKNGPVQGVLKESRSSTKFVSYLGLRYADLPGRFEKAHLISETWFELRLLDKPGSNCPQMTETAKLIESEDCLFLNVHVPQQNEDILLPVMFYIHGGGFAFGDGAGYGPEYFMENGEVILVTINYRLGVLGFLTMEDDVIPSNLGLRDQVLALKWVKENIRFFGGDPEQVTIFGNSAGSAAVYYMLLSPSCKGLFRRAIMQSSAFSFWSYSPNPRSTALKLATYMNCTLSLNSDSEDVSLQVLECLKGKTTREIVTAQASFWPRFPKANGISWFSPTDKEFEKSAFFPHKLRSFFTKDKRPNEYINKVPVMLGTTRDEGSTLFTACVLSEEGALQKLNENWELLAPKTFCFEDFFPSEKLPEISKRVRNFYFGNKDNLSDDSIYFLSTLYTDTLFLLPILQAGIEMSMDDEITVYPYVFSYVGKWSLRDALNVFKMKGMIGHADELQYQFPHSFLGPPLEARSISEKFSKRLIKLWTSFAKTGIPAADAWTEGMEVDFRPIKISGKKHKEIKFDVLRIDTKLKLVELQFLDRLYFWRDLLNECVFMEGNATKFEEKSEL